MIKIEHEIKGLFTIIHEGKEIDVMFYHDYLRWKVINEWQYNKSEVCGFVKSLYINGRKRNARLVYFGNQEIEFDVVGNVYGVMEVKISGLFQRCVMINQYVQMADVWTKQGVEAQIKSGKLDAAQLMGGRRKIVFVILNS